MNNLWLHLPLAQPFLEWTGQRRARAVFRRASRSCPAYRQFLQQADYANSSGAPPPITTKENYIKPYSIASRCYGGRIPRAGVVIDESSGSSGTPNQWVRGPKDRGDVTHLLQNSYHTVYPDREERLLLNCFALGPWATGMQVSMALAAIAILKSVGPDTHKLENALQTFGPEYHYLIFGYPPFLKDFFATTKLDLSGYSIDLVVGGEGMSENLRDHLLRRCRSVLSSYGASDLDINVGMETPFTLALRRRCVEDPALCRELFGRDYPPMLFQYNPHDYVIERLPDGELVFTVARPRGTTPKIRYNLHDLGGIWKMRDLDVRLASHGISPQELSHSPRSALPLLYVFGRSDMTVPFYGAKVFASDIEQILTGDPALEAGVHSFQISNREEGESLRRYLCIALESADGDAALPSPETLRDSFYEALCRINQDFREVSRLFERSQIEVTIYPFETGPFASVDKRLKNRYIGTLQ